MAEPKPVSSSSHPPPSPRPREDFFKAFFEVLAEAVYAVDLSDWIITYWNSGANSLFGYTAQEAVGRTIQLLHSEPVFLAKMLNAMAPAVREKGYWSGPLRYQHRDGFHFEAEAFALAFFQSEPTTYYITVAHNVRASTRSQEVRGPSDRRTDEITEGKHPGDERRSQDLFATMNTTAARFAHEIGNPLNGMYTTVQILERQLAKKKDAVDEATFSTLQDLMTEIDRLRALLQDFRSLPHTQQLELQSVDLAAIVAELLAVEERQYAEKGIHVERNFAPDLPPIKADSEKLRQVLLNLCNNAVEAMPEGGTLTLRGYREGEHAILEVSDIGTGIPQGMDIFEAFATSKPYGSGLGLAIVQQIISAHGGTVSHTSEPGKGTTFRLFLPLGR